MARFYDLDGLRQAAKGTSSEGLSDEELVIEYSRRTGTDAQQVAEYLGLPTGRGSSAFGAGLGMGFDQAQAMVAGTGAALADVAGFTGVRDALEAEARQQQAQSYLARNPEVAQRVEDIRGLGDVPGYVAGQLGQQVSIVGGIIGASALGTLAGGPVGGLAAGLGTSYTYGVGSLYNEALEGGERQTGEALAKAVPYAAAEALLPLGIGRVARGAGIPGISSIASRPKRVAAAGGAGAVTEAATELFQTSLEIGMRDDLSPEEIYSRYLNAAVSGGLVGGGFSAAGATFGRAPQPETDPDADVTDTDVDTGPVDTAPENNVVPDAEGGVNLAGSQAEVDANRVAQEQDAELRELNKAEWRESLLPLTGGKLTRGDRRKLEGRKKNLEYDLEVAEEVAPLATAGKGKSKRRRKKELVAERRSELQQELNNINTQLAADNVARMAEADLTGLDNDVTPVERAIAEAEQRAQAEAEAAQRVQGDVSPEVAPETLEEGVDLAQQVAPAARPETEVAPEPAVEPVQAVSPVVEPDLQVAQDATEATPEAVSPVVEEELVTAEDIEAEVQKDQDIARTLAAEVESDNVKVAGPITLEQPVIAAIARHLRSPKASGLNVVYEPGTANPVEVAPEISAQIDGVRQAVFAVAQAKASYDNVASNILDKDTDADIVGKEDTATAVAEANYEKRETARQNLVTAVENFIAVAGGRPNANAIIAAFKTTKEKRGKSRDLNSAESEFLSGVMPTKRGLAYKKLAGFHQQLDIGLSSAFRAYTNGELTASPDFAPRSAPVRQNKQQREAEKKAGIRLFERDLQAAVEGGALGNSARTTPDRATISKIDDAVKSEKARLKEQRDNKTLTVPQYRKAVKDAEARGQAAKDAEQAKIDARLAETQGFEALINRALDTGVANVTERLIAKLARRAIKARRDAGIPDPVIEFGDESSFDPNKTAGGTITLKRESSPEVVAHEALHALLQGFVYANRSTRVPGHDPEVVKTVDLLRGYVKTLVNLDMDKLNDSLTPAQKAKASEAISVLRDLVNRGDANGEVDAVLELISYGNTLRDMKMLLTRVERRRTEKTADWRTTLRGIFEVIRRLLNKLTGASDTAANDVIDATVALLEGVTAKPVAPKKGKKLMVGKPTKVDPTSSTSAFGIDVRDEAQLSDWVLSTKVFFDLLNWDKRMKWSGEKLTGLNKTIRREMPGIEKVVRYLNPYYGLQNLAKFVKEFKSDKHTGYLRAEEFASVIRRSSKEDVQKMFDYLDSETQDASLLDGVKYADKRKAMLDSLRSFINEYVESLDDASKASFKRRPFSESLFFVSDTTDIGSRRFGVSKKISRIIGKQEYKEVNLEDEWIYPEGETELSDSPVYLRVIKRLPNGEVRHEGFIHEQNAALFNGAPYKDGVDLFEVEPELTYKVEETPSGYSFSRQMTARQALSTADYKEGREKLSLAMLNTVGSLANYFASKGLVNSLYSAGRANGTLDINSLNARSEPVLVFDSIEQLNAYNKHFAGIDGYTHRPVGPDNIPSANADELKSGIASQAVGESGNYVRIPEDSETWGALRGKILPAPVYSGILSASSQNAVFDTDVARTYSGILRWFKKSKTIYNPGTHVTNAASNVTIAMGHGLTRKTVIRAGELLLKYYLTPNKLNASELAIVNGFMNSGAVLGDFSVAEVKKAVIEATVRAMRSNNEKRGAFGWAMDAMNLERYKSENLTEVAKKAKDIGVTADEIATTAYATGDNIFRFAAFLQRAGQLQAQKDSTDLTAEELRTVGIDARNMFLDYDIDSKALQLARQTVLPFASWTYAIIPVITNMAITQPWRIANIFAAYAALDLFASMLAGEDEDYRKRLGSMYNERVFGIGPHSMIRIPFLGSDTQPVYYRLGDYIPLSSTFKAGPNGFMGIEGFPSGLMPNGPLISAFSMVANTDLYTGKEIYLDTDDALDRFLSLAKAGYDTFTPPLISSRNKENLDKYLNDAPTVSGRSMTSMWAVRAFGFKFYDPYTSDEAAWKQIRAKAIMREYETAMYKARREMVRSGSYDTEALNAELIRLNERMREEVDEVFNSD